MGKQKIEFQTASAFEQVGLELSIMERLLSRRGMPPEYRMQLHKLVLAPMLQALREEPKLISAEFLPKLRRLRDQLDRSIERIEDAVQAQRRNK